MTKESYSEIDIAFHEATAASYDEEITAVYGVYHRYLLEPFLDRLMRGGGVRRALDLGSGTGVIALAMASRGMEVLGIDHSPEMLEIAEAKARSLGLSSSCTFITGDVSSVPAEDGAFDCVTCQGLLHHLPDMQGCLAELKRVLRPGGYFYISEPTREQTPLKRFLRFLARMRRLGREPVIKNEPLTIEEPINPGRLNELLGELGLPHETQFLTHLPPLRRRLPERLYVLVMRAASAPWRRRTGDLVFVFGQKPPVD